MMEKTQFNARVQKGLKQAAVQVAEAGDFTTEEIVEIALANLFGTQDELMVAKRNKVQRIVAQLNLKLSFKGPQLLLVGIGSLAG